VASFVVLVLNLFFIMITFSVVAVRLVCHCCATFGAIFDNYFCFKVIKRNVLCVISAGVRELEPPKYKCEAPIIVGLGRNPQLGPGAEPLVQESGGFPLKLKHFWLFQVY